MMLVRVGFLGWVVFCPELGGNRHDGHTDQRRVRLASTVWPFH
jgi:hypothetical protein